MSRSPIGSGRRKPQRRHQRRRFLIACEGQKEVAYFKWLSKRLSGNIVLKPVQRKSAPEHVLDLAIHERDSDRQAARESGDPDDTYDGVWIVVDVDEHAHLNQTLVKAGKVGIDSAVSGPCFEVWLILHCEDRRAAYTAPKAVKDHWGNIVGSGRTTQQELDHLDGHLADAMTRAAALLTQHASDGLSRDRRNPSTEVGLLVRVIVDAAGIDPDQL